MIKGIERMLEVFEEDHWQYDEESDQIELLNKSKTRKLVYKTWPENLPKGPYISKLELHFKDEVGEWQSAFRMRYVIGESFERYFFVVKEGDSKPFEWSRDITFDPLLNGKLQMGQIIRPNLPTDDGSYELPADMKELRYAKEDIPDKLDFEMTANLFVDQFLEGDMRLPVLVPAGLFTYVEPQAVPELSSTSVMSAPNRTKAAKLYLWAVTPMQKRIAGAINKWVSDYEERWRSFEG